MTRSDPRISSHYRNRHLETLNESDTPRRWARVGAKLAPNSAGLSPLLERVRLASVWALRNRLVQSIGPLIVSALCVACLWLGADALVRQRWSDGATATQLAAGLWCIAAVSISLGLVAAAAMGSLALGRRFEATRVAWLVWLARASVLGGVVAALVLPTARWTFSGTWIRNHPSANWGPAVLTLVCVLGATLFALALAWAAQRQRKGKYGVARWLAAASIAAALAAVYIDLHVYVALYARLHSALEAVGFALLVSGTALLLREFRLRSTRFSDAVAGTALAGMVIAPMPAVSESLFEDLEADLTHAYKEQVYVGRQLQRIKLARAFLRDPWAWEGEQAAQLDQLKREYDLVTTDLDPKWTEPLVPSARAVSCDDCNVLVFYVDTLRRDVALDPKLMPNVARFASQSMNFNRAYATGSDTLNSLPGLTGGNYALREAQPGDLLNVAEQAGMHRLLTIPKSAREFLSKLHPNFKFDEVLEVADYQPEKNGVWGYGADQPSIEPLVDGLLDWIETHRDQRFLSWLFTFEVHNWRELDDDYVARAAGRAGIGQDDERWRYWAIANEVDRQFGRLLQGLESSGLNDKTIVLFVSDHGEALGEWDFWLHGVVVWESLVRVPLLMRIPGVEPQAVETPVSLIDVPVTLAPILSQHPPSPNYQGFSLLESAAGKRRPHPIMFVGQRKETLVRIGVLDPESNYKLVLPLETGKPELYDTSVTGPDDRDLANDSPLKVANLLNIAVRSPMFPRSPDEPEGDAPK